MRDLALWRLQCCTHGAWCRTCPSGLGTSEASQTMALMSRPCPTSMNHITTGLPCNGWPTRWKSMGWRASCMRPMCPWCDWACATYSWRAIIWTPRCSSSTIACFTVTTLASLRTPGSALLPRRGRKKLKRMKNMWGPPVATHSWPSGSMSGCPLRATTRTRQRASAGRRCQWQHPTFANARFLSASPWDQYAGASAGHTQGPHLGEYPYTRLAEGQVLGPTTHLQIRGVVQGGHWNPYMAGFYEDAGDVADPQVSLISSYFRHLVLIPTSLLCWYLLNGLVVTHLYLLMQDDSRWGFKSLAGDCAQKRRDTQRDPPQALARELAKLLMTSLYGKSCENKKRFLRTYFMKGATPSKAICSNCFRDMRPLLSTPQPKLDPEDMSGDSFQHQNDVLETEMADHYELAMAQEHLTLYLPIQITVFVYGYVHCTWTLIAITWAWTGKVFMTSSDQSTSYEHFHEWFPREACDAHRAEFVDMITHLGPCAWYPVQQCWGPSAVWWKDTRDKEWCSDGMVALCS